jgi:hypothetical protein
MTRIEKPEKNRKKPYILIVSPKYQNWEFSSKRKLIPITYFQTSAQYYLHIFYLQLISFKSKCTHFVINCFFDIRYEKMSKFCAIILIAFLVATLSGTSFARNSDEDDFDQVKSKSVQTLPTKLIR